MDSLNRLSQSIQQAAAQFASLKRERDELRAEAARAARQAAEDRFQLEKRLSEAMALVEKLRDTPPVDDNMLERVRRAELEAAQFCEDLETTRKQAQQQLESLKQERDTEVWARQQCEAQLAGLQQKLAESEKLASQDHALQMEDLKADLAAALRQAGDAQARIDELEKTLAQGANPEQASAWLERIAQLETRLREVGPVAAKAEDLEKERGLARTERRRAQAYLKERAGIKRRLEEVHQQLEALKLT